MRDRHGVLLVAALALAPAGCVSAARARASAARVPLSVSEALYVGVMASADARSLDSAAFARALASTDSWVRGYAALSAGQMHATELAPTLRALVGDGDAGVASRAAYALGLLHDTASVSTLAAAVLRRPVVGVEAAWSLGELGVPARAALLRLLAQPTIDDTTLVEVALAAGRLRPSPVEELRPLLSHTSLGVRWAAAYSLTRGRNPGATRALIAAAGAESGVARPSPQTARTYAGAAGRAELRSFVARGMARSAAGDSLAVEARALLHRLAADPDARVRVNAVRSLATYGADERDMVRAAAADRDANVRVTAAEGYASGGDRAPESWMALWSSDTGFMFRRSLLIGATGAGVRLPALETWAVRGDWRARAAVAEALSSPGADSLWPRGALTLLSDRDGRVRAAAVGALAAGLDSSGGRGDQRSALLGLLNDADPYVVAAVIDALATAPRVGELEPVLRAYRAHPAPDALDARVAALRYVVATWTAFPTASEAGSAIAALAAGAAPTTPVERLVVHSIPALSAWQRASVPAHDRAFYERVVREVVRPGLRGLRPVAVFATGRGEIRAELLPLDAPLTVDNFLTLAERGTYRGGTFHRVVPNFVAQDGDPRGDGSGGVGYTIRDELNPVRYTRGTLGMALSGPDTGGSQYFLTLSGQPHLDGHYTVFGRMLTGWVALDQLVQGDRLDAVTIVR